MGGLPSMYLQRTPVTNLTAREGDIVLSELVDLESEHLISDPTEPDSKPTRKIIRPGFVHQNVHDSTASVKIKLVHQRRSTAAAKSGDRWEDTPGFKLSKLSGGEEAHFDLGCRETKRLYVELTRLYQHMGTCEQILTEAGITVVDESEITIPRNERQEAIARLHAEDPNFWDRIADLGNLPEALIARKQHQLRQEALDEFENAMAWDEWTEAEWQKYFERNTWIFGYGLAYQFLSNVENQPHYGGTIVTGKGAQRGDFLLRTEASARFTAIVDIKKPSTNLLKQRTYRGIAIHQVSDEVSGGVSQVQANCSTWESEGSKSPANVRALDRDRTFTHGPKGFLIVGHTEQLTDDEQAGSFQRFRRNLHNPEIVTFDELLERARFLVQTDFEAHTEPEDDTYDEVPF